MISKNSHCLDEALIDKFLKVCKQVAIKDSADGLISKDTVLTVLSLADFDYELELILHEILSVDQLLPKKTSYVACTYFVRL